jgi:hypothetical protein
MPEDGGTAVLVEARIAAGAVGILGGGVPARVAVTARALAGGIATEIVSWSAARAVSGNAERGATAGRAGVSILAAAADGPAARRCR